MRFPVVLFDLDGTVVDSGGIILASMRYATREVLGRDYADDELMQAVGGPGLEAQMHAFAPDRVDVLLDYAHALYPPGKASGPLPAEFAQLMRRILALAPEHAEALFFVGEAEAEAGNRAEAVTLWQKLLAKLDPASPTYAAIQKRIDGQSQTN